jgi:hypothetical protein
VPQLDPPILELNCLIYDDDASHIFPVEIASSKSVGALKKAIKEEMKPALDHVTAASLTLWKVSIPIDGSFEENVKAELEEEEMLSPVDTLSDIFSNLKGKHLHIIVKSPLISECK